MQSLNEDDYIYMFLLFHFFGDFLYFMDLLFFVESPSVYQ